jgi:aminomethyltransferase
LRKTPFHDYHLQRNAKMVDFAGWEMPIHYGSIIEEHQAVRSSAGIFDVSHMGRVEFRGRHARRFLERVLSRKISDMAERTCRYSMICNESGGVKDDVLVYRFEDHWLLVVNASNREKLLEHFDAVRGDLAVKINDTTEKTGMVAVQGPDTMDFVSSFSREIPTLNKYHFTIKNLLVLKLIVSRTGYTGEDGIEIILPANAVNMALKLLLKEDEHGETKVKPCGLGARDTLRMEAGMPLYGHELTEEIDPLSAGLKFAVSLDKHEDEAFGEPERFIGQDALERIAADGPPRQLVGLKLDGKRTPRQHMAVQHGGEPIGQITSGCLSPTLGHPIAMAYVDPAQSDPGTTLAIDFGRKTADAQIVKLPFYKPPKS